MHFSLFFGQQHSKATDLRRCVTSCAQLIAGVSVLMSLLEGTLMRFFFYCYGVIPIASVGFDATRFRQEKHLLKSVRASSTRTHHSHHKTHAEMHLAGVSLLAQTILRVAD